MSFTKIDRLFPNRILDTELAKLVANALHEDYGDSASAVKEIGRRTGANLRAIRNWFEARHTPSSSHLLTLARSSPSLLKLVLEQVGGTDLSEAFHLLGRQGIERCSQVKNDPKNVPINVPIKSRAGDLNERQRWFLNELRKNSKPVAGDIASYWKVALKTAKRDIANLKFCGIVNYMGSKKSGQYVVTDWPLH